LKRKGGGGGKKKEKKEAFRKKKRGKRVDPRALVVVHGHSFPDPLRLHANLKDC